MGHMVPRKALKIIRAQPVLVPQFHSIGPALWKLTEKLIQVGNEVPAMLLIGRSEPGKLEHQQAHVGPHGLAGPQERLHEQFRIEEVLIGFSSQLTEAIQLRELLNRDGIRHLESEEEIIRHLRDHAIQDVPI